MIERKTITLANAGDRESMRDAFSQPLATTDLVIDEPGLHAVAEELELDADMVVLDAKRYVDGKYRPKAAGFSGGRLGDFGEVLTYVVKLAEGVAIERVVGARGATATTDQDDDDSAGVSFPFPDFVVSESATLRALEVKATELLDYQRLLAVHRRPDPRKGYRWLQPCDGVTHARARALRQLGLELDPDGGYDLLTRSGSRVPFPTPEATAVAVLVRDGRVDELVANEKRFKTPKGCREGHWRNCWDCIGDHRSKLGVALVEMPNERGLISSLPSEGAGEAWFLAYRHWARALWSYVPGSIDLKTRALLNATEEWLRIVEGHSEFPFLRAYWHAAVEHLARRRGIEAAWASVEPAVPHVHVLFAEETGSDVFVTPVGDADQAATTFDRVRGTRRRVALESVDGLGSVSILVDPSGHAEVRALAPFWSRREVDSTREAQEFVANLWEIVTRVFARFPLTLTTPTVSPVTARLGERELSLGWAMDFALTADGGYLLALVAPEGQIECVPRGHVYRDGRAFLSFRWRPRTP